MTNKDRKNKIIQRQGNRRTEGTEGTNDKEKPLPQPLPHREGSEYRDTPSTGGKKYVSNYKLCRTEMNSISYHLMYQAIVSLTVSRNRIIYCIMQPYNLRSIYPLC